MIKPSPQDLARSIIDRQFLAPEEFAAGVAAPSLLDEAAAKPFGKYLVLRKIGEGGFSRVFLALDPLLGRRVALKVLKRATPDDVARFRREARVAAELNHPHIVPVYEVGQVGKESFIAMGFIEGAPPERLEIDRALEVALKVARALGAAHSQGLIHRDVKPQNIILDGAGEPFLTDFGMAKHFDAEGTGALTQTGTMVGTPAFMSPEQARGEMRAMGPASDVFSLGATLYFLCTGRAPFAGETGLEVVRKVIETRPIPPRVVDPRVPAEVEAIILKAMTRDPQGRYASGEEMADDLQRFLERRPVLAERRRLTRYWIAGASAVLAAGVLIAIVSGGRALAPAPGGEPRPKTVEAPAAARKPPEPKPALPAPSPARPPKSETAVKPPAPPPSPAESKPALPEIDAALKARVRERVLDQPAYFLRTFLTDAEQRRARELLAADRAREEDLEFLRKRLDVEAANLIELEKAFIATAIAERELDARRVETPDLIRLKEGRQHEGRVLEEGASSVRYVFRDQTVTLPRSMIESIERGGSSESQFVKRLEPAVKAKNLQDLIDLAEWCRERGLRRQREYVFCRVLGIEPGSVPARRELGLPLTGPLRAPPLPSGEPERHGEFFTFEGKQFTADELRQTLRDRGYIVLAGQWCLTREWKWGPHEYWKTKALAVGGTDVARQTWDEAQVETVYDLDLMKLVQVRKYVTKFHFIGPAAPKGEAGPRTATGTAVIEVGAPAPIVDCRIKASSLVMDGRGSIEVSVAVEGRQPTRLFSNASGAESGWHDASEILRGARRFTLVARIQSDFEQDSGDRPRAGALFLPGDAKDPEPLSIQGRVAEPAPRLNALLPPK